MLFSQELQRRGMHICGLPDISIVFIMFKTWGGGCVQPTGSGGLLGRLFGTQRTISALERQLNQNINPVTAHNEYMERTFGSRL